MTACKWFSRNLKSYPTEQSMQEVTVTRFCLDSRQRRQILISSKLPFSKCLPVEDQIHITAFLDKLDLLDSQFNSPSIF